MLIFEFLSRISFFSILTWGFLLIAVICAIILTNLSSPFIRKYRNLLIAVGASSFVLGGLSATTPFFLSRWNPDQSRLTPIDELVTTEWLEPVLNPATELPADEIAWTKELPYRFKYKLKLGSEFRKALAVESSQVAWLDGGGSLHGFDAYTGLNHWTIPAHASAILGQLVTQKKLYLLDRSRLGRLRISCFDLVSPSLLWQRVVPGAVKEGSISFDPESQSVIVSAGSNGVWCLKAKTGEILWKRPEIFSKNGVIASPKHLLAFEPVVAGHAGSWYFLDAQTGKILQKIPHSFSEIQSFLPPDQGMGEALNFIGRVDEQNYIYFNQQDLKSGWNFHAPASIKLARYLDNARYFLLYDSGLLELRNLADNSLIYQKTLTSINSQFLKLSPDRSLFALSSPAEDESTGIAFFDVETGEYRVTARTGNPILDVQFFGDWMYLFSENFVWALKKN